MGPLGKRLIPCLVTLLALAPSLALAWGQPLKPSAQEAAALQGLAGVPGGEIVFTSRRDGRWRLFRVNSDGTDLTRLSTGPGNHTRPVFVKNGTKLLYQSDESGVVQMWLAEPDLGNPANISPEGREEWFQGASRDADKILVATRRDPRHYFLRLMNQRREVPLRFPGDFKKGELYARLSPDARWLAFQFKPEGGGQAGRGVYSAELGLDGKVFNVKKVHDGCFVDWRGDSTAFLTSRFLLMRGLPGTHIWLAGRDRPLEKLTSQVAWHYFARFSPDERWMVWGTSPLTSHDHMTGRYEIMVKPLKGGEPVRMTFHSAPDIEPTWRARRGPRVERQAKLYFEAEDNYHGGSQAVDDPAAGNKKAVLAPLHMESRAFVYGQYSQLPPGEYTAWFSLRAPGGGDPKREIAAVDVAAEGGKVLAAREILLDQLAPGAYLELPLKFRSDRPIHDLELRVHSRSGVADLYVDRITVGPAPPADWHRRHPEWVKE